MKVYRKYMNKYPKLIEFVKFEIIGVVSPLLL